MRCHIYGDAPDVSTKHGHLEQYPEVVPLHDCNVLFRLSHVIILLVDEIFVWVQEVTTFDIKLLHDGKNLYAPQK